MMKCHGIKLKHKGKCNIIKPIPLPKPLPLPIPPPRPLPTGCNCPEIYDPVCGQDNNTYDNKCFLKCKNIKLKHKGKCNTFIPKPLPFPLPRPLPVICPCPKIYKPVCG